MIVSRPNISERTAHINGMIKEIDFFEKISEFKRVLVDQFTERNVDQPSYGLVWCIGGFRSILRNGCSEKKHWVCHHYRTSLLPAHLPRRTVSFDNVVLSGLDFQLLFVAGKIGRGVVVAFEELFCPYSFGIRSNNISAKVRSDLSHQIYCA